MSLFPLSKYIPRSRIADKFIVNFVKKKKELSKLLSEVGVYTSLYSISLSLSCILKSNYVIRRDELIFKLISD